MLSSRNGGGPVLHHARKRCRSVTISAARSEILQLCRFGALPVAAEVDARLVLGDKGDDRLELRAIRFAAMIVTPAGLGGVSRDINAGDVMVMADLCPEQSAEKFLGS